MLYTCAVEKKSDARAAQHAGGDAARGGSSPGTGKETQKGTIRSEEKHTLQGRDRRIYFQTLTLTHTHTCKYDTE